MVVRYQASLVQSCLALVLTKNCLPLMHVDNICKKISPRIRVLKKVRNYLPHKQRLIYYNATISQNRVLKLQKRAGRVILDARPQAPSVPLFNRLKWLPFYDDTKITKCCFAFRRTRRTLPTYLDELLKLNSERHERKADTLILT